jgi:conjugal transfer mating pair stabilization protein TraG
MLLAVLVIAYPLSYYEKPKTVVDPAAYKPLLNTIAKGESSGNYNAYYGNASNTSLHLTEMSVASVMQWQANYVQKGSPSSAAGKYQIVRPTLSGLVAQLHIAPQERFDESLQDRLAIALLERHGATAYIEKKITPQEFGANLAKEWAALPKLNGTNPHESYYAGDGLNASRISPQEVYEALATLDREAAKPRH